MLSTVEAPNEIKPNTRSIEVVNTLNALKMPGMAEMSFEALSAKKSEIASMEGESYRKTAVVRS